MRLQIASIFFSCLIAGALFVACSNQAEGERCDPRFGNDDCKDGLVCKRATELGGLYDLCCPATGANVAECRRSISTDGGDLPAPDATTTDGATTDGATTSDAGSDSGSDAPVDSASDAPKDAPADGSDAGDQ